MRIERGGGRLDIDESDDGPRKVCFIVMLLAILIIVIFVIVAAILLYFNFTALERGPAVMAKNEQVDDSCRGVICPPYGECQAGECHCPSGCRSDRPVCGSSGETYPSECHIHRHNCIYTANVTVLHRGPCKSSSSEPCNGFQCHRGALCVTNSEGAPECQCRPRCPQEDSQHAVCGSDGTDYSSECELLRSACVLNKDVQVRYAGMCDPCGHVVCGTGQVCLVNDARVPRCQCNSTCSSTLSPVCASNGVTYSNECVMNFEACSKRQVLSVLYRGECASGVNPCGTLRCGTGKGCVVNQYGIASCKCQKWCAPVVKPVCGSDGITYDSRCHLERSACINQKFIKISFVGNCGSEGPCKDFTCEFGGVCVEKYGKAECECIDCGGEYLPVCGGDRRTYHSPCQLRRQVCVNRSHVERIHDGPCDACKGIQCGEFGVCEVDQEGFGRCSCPTNCTGALGGEVCGSDGETYSSECQMQITACSSLRTLKILHKGSCDLCANVHCKYGARCEGGRCICPTDCPAKREPVCGSDRVTYSNECVMRKVACEKNEDVSYVFFGECDEIGGIVTDVIYPSPLPPTDPEDPCHVHTCIAGADCISELDGRFRCVCDFYCSPPPRYEPVCGSDMEFYESECLMRLHACNIQVQLYVKPVRECATAQNTRACNGTSPLINPSTGEDLYCGPGGTICPPGTYCHKGNDFAKCCRDYSIRIAVIEAPVPDECGSSDWGCCEDGINFAKGPDSEGCPEACRCHKLGAVREACDAVTGECDCRPGVGGNNCDRCLPGYYGLHRVSSGAVGCTPCGCSLFGSMRTDCKQMTGECVCKSGVTGHRCTHCSHGQVLRLEGCVYEDHLVPQATTCDLLQCHFGGHCQESNGVASCICSHHCLPSGVGGEYPVCGSDGRTYASECELRYETCLKQADIVVVAFGPCTESWTDAPVRRSTAEDGWSKHHTQATRRHALSTIIESPPPGVTPIAPLDSEELDSVYPLPASTKESYVVPGFSGSSYLQMMPWSVPMKVQLEVELVAHAGDGVLLYVQQDFGGEGDYLALVLHDGYPELRLDLGNGPISLRAPRPVPLFTKITISVRTYSRDALLQVGTGEAVSGRSAGVHRALDIHAPLYVGGIPSTATHVLANVGGHRGFTGCIRGLQVSHQNLDLVWGRSPSVGHAHNISECRTSPCSAHPCLNGGTCVPTPLNKGFRCRCLSSHAGATCDLDVNEGCRRLQCPSGTTCVPVTASSALQCVPEEFGSTDQSPTWPVADLKGESYLALPQLEAVTEGVRLELWFLTRSPHGMLLYEGEGPAQKGDFISLNLASGYVQFRFDVGAGVVNLTSAEAVEEGTWHRVVAAFEGSQASLQVNENPPVTSTTLTTPHTLTLNTPVYLGGFKLWYMVSRASGILVGLDGAIQRLKANQVVYDRLTESATEQRGVTSYRGPPCFPNPCANDGLCVPLLGNFSCRCSFMFVGRMCERSLSDVNPDQPIYFDGSTSLLYPGQLALNVNKSRAYVPWNHPDYDYLEYEDVQHNHLMHEVGDGEANDSQGRPHDVLEVSFRAESSTGLLLWSGRGRGSARAKADYIALTLIDGFPQLALNLGRARKPFILTATTTVDDGAWHVVRVTRRWRRALLKVDNHRAVRGRAPRGAITLHTDGDLWIGGQGSVPAQLGAAFHTGFQGCVDRVLVDGREVHLVHHAASRLIQFCQTLT